MAHENYASFFSHARPKRLNKIRFINMVPVNSRVRGRVTLLRASLGEGTCRIISEVTVEIEGEEKPAMKAETITLFFE